MMIDAEMYGMTPSAKIDRRCSAPPENMLKMSRIVPCCCWKKRAGATPQSGSSRQEMKARRRWLFCCWWPREVLDVGGEGRGLRLDLAAGALDSSACDLGDVHALDGHGAGHGAGRDDARPFGTVARAVTVKGVHVTKGARAAIEGA